MPFPSARRDDTIDRAHGHQVPAPYRWLENPDSEETREFVAAQNAFAEPILEALPARNAFRERVGTLLAQKARGIPHQRGGRLFAWHGNGENQDVLVVADDAAGLASPHRRGARRRTHRDRYPCGQAPGHHR